PKSQLHSPTRLSARAVSPVQATLSCSLRAHHRSTCSKVTPIAAINFANWCKRSRNETDQNPAPFQPEENAGSDGAPGVGGVRRNGLRRNSRAKHEVVAGIADC